MPFCNFSRARTTSERPSALESKCSSDGRSSLKLTMDYVEKPTAAIADWKKIQSKSILEWISKSNKAWTPPQDVFYSSKL
jgi:hypothetical protein